MRPRLALALVALAAVAACRSPSPAPPAAAPPSLLAVADARFAGGEYAAAAEAYRRHLAEDDAEERQRVLFRLALVHLLPESSLHDPAEGRRLLARLARGPAGPYREAASYLLGLQGEVAELRRQLEEIKRIDLEGLLDDPGGR